MASVVREMGGCKGWWGLGQVEKEGDVASVTEVNAADERADGWAQQ